LTTGTMNETTSRTSNQVQWEIRSPKELKAILLSDGWHEISDATQVQFAVSQSASPPAPNKVYPALSYLDRKSGRRVTSSFKQILAYSFEE